MESTSLVFAPADTFPSFVHFCPFLFISVHFCPFLSISVHFCPFLLISIDFCPSLFIFVHFCPFLFISVYFVHFCLSLTHTSLLCLYLCSFYRDLGSCMQPLSLYPSAYLGRYSFTCILSIRRDSFFLSLSLFVCLSLSLSNTFVHAKCSSHCCLPYLPPPSPPP